MKQCMEISVRTKRGGRGGPHFEKGGDPSPPFLQKWKSPTREGRLRLHTYSESW